MKRRIGFILTFCLFLLASPNSSAQRSPNNHSPAVSTELTNRVVKIIPPGFTLVRVAKNAIPDGWASNDPFGILVEAHDGHVTTCKAWILPGDWLGILVSPDNFSLDSPLQLMYFAEGQKIVVYCTSSMAGRFRDFEGASARRLAEKAWKTSAEIFKGRQEEVEREVTSLIREYCHDDRSKAVAASSIEFLKVSSETVKTICVRSEPYPETKRCLAYLGGVGDKESFEKLKRLIEDPDTADDVIVEAGTNLVWSEGFFRGKKEACPVLMTGIRRTTSTGVFDRLVKDIMQIGCPCESAELLTLLKHEGIQQHFAYKIIHALALSRPWHDKRYVEELCAEQDLYSRNVYERDHGLSFSLARAENLAASCRIYLGPWGERQHGIRLQLVPPKEANVGKRVRFTLIYENESGRSFGYDSVTYLVDGQEYRYEDRSGGWIGPAYIQPRSFSLKPVYLPLVFSKPGKHTVQVAYQYEEPLSSRRIEELRESGQKPVLTTILSNIVTIEIKP